MGLEPLMQFLSSMRSFLLSLMTFQDADSCETSTVHRTATAFDLENKN